jgi:hypothetical protein
VTLRLVLQIGWQNRLPNEATRMVAGYLLGWVEKMLAVNRGVKGWFLLGK